MERKRIKIVYTGGTIGSEPNDSNLLVPGKTLEKYLLEDINELRQRDRDLEPNKEYIPDFDFVSLPSLLDSSNMRPMDWNTIVKEIAPVILGEEKDIYEGVLILHGTDTMAYTASALSFMLEGIHLSGKYVVITGSQVPYYKARSDARHQLISAMILTAFGKIPEVVLFFNDKAFRGCRTTKVDADGFGAFDSPNFPPLGRFGIEFSEDEHIRLATDQKRFKKQNGFQKPQIHFLYSKSPRQFHSDNKIPEIGILKLYPGISAETLRAVGKNLDAIVIEGFGSGNGPISDKSNVEFLRAFTLLAYTKPIVVVTQCLRGKVSDLYGTGLVSAGGIDGRDMTTEASIAKLHYLFSKYGNANPSLIREKFNKDHAGEMTISRADENKNAIGVAAKLLNN